MDPSHLFKKKAFISLLKPHEHCSMGGAEEHVHVLDAPLSVRRVPLAGGVPVMVESSRKGTTLQSGTAHVTRYTWESSLRYPACGNIPPAWLRIVVGSCSLCSNLPRFAYEKGQILGRLGPSLSSYSAGRWFNPTRRLQTHSSVEFPSKKS